ncbi:MAG: DUF296 domain-containing protein [Myxococcota bacterium]|nr:DUF296 domain-containing protein [Myxococcota bacterium]
MKYGTSIRVRHFVGRLEKGEEVIESLRKLCFRERIRAAAFKGLGILSSAELQEFVPSMQKYVSRFCADTMFELVSLSGNISTLGNEVIINASAVMSYTLFNQQHIVAGHLLTAKAHVVEFAIVSFDDVVLERTYDPSTGLPLWNRIATSELAEFAMPEPTPSPSSDSMAVLAPDTSTPADAIERISVPVDTLEASGVHLATPKREPMVIRRRGSKSREDGSIDGTPSELLPIVDSELSTPSPANPPPALSSPGTAKPAPAAPSIATAPAPATESSTKSAAPNVAAAEPSEWQHAVRTVKTAEAKARVKLPSSTPRPIAAVEPDEEEDEFELLEGDWLEHPTLGECKVSRVEDDDWAFIKVGNKIRKLALKAFEIVPIEGEHRRYKLVKRRDG